MLYKLTNKFYKLIIRAGQDGENYEEAAKELEDIIRNTVPVDFECESVYEDLGVNVIMGTKDGKGFYMADFESMEDF